MTKDETSEGTPELQMSTSDNDGTGFLRRMLMYVLLAGLAGFALMHTRLGDDTRTRANLAR